MTRQHFEALAAALHEARDHLTPLDCGWDAVDIVAGHIADACATDNPRFDRARFLAAVRQGSGVSA